MPAKWYPRRPGTASLELLFIVPILLALTVAVMQFSMLVTAQQELAAASREGARALSLSYSDDEVRKTIKDFLGEGRLQEAKITIKSKTSSNLPIPSGESVEVTLEIPVAEAVPNFLGFIGFSFGDDVLIARSVMRKE